ncbi:LPD11 domain-containing protein [Streptococcus sanguinis]|uniref:LPD11 domain-containing protein n=1 Tax=Streptococcus sanguinis TaxID=1305 RepID=UPI0007795998|nr:LPD11 domain-containing protein [Streptococcus sanguinis]
MEFAIVTNTETGQRGRFPLPFRISALEKIGVTESFKGQLYVLPEGEKPEWLTWEEILQYERRMTEEDK